MIAKSLEIVQGNGETKSWIVGYQETTSRGGLTPSQIVMSSVLSKEPGWAVITYEEDEDIIERVNLGNVVRYTVKKLDKSDKSDKG